MKIPYLSSEQVGNCLADGNCMGIEQWLNCKDLSGFRVICWIRIVREGIRSPGKWIVYYKQSLDHAVDGFFSIDDFQEVGDPDLPEGERLEFDTAEAALNHAVKLGARLDRFVPFGSMHLIYEIFVSSNPKPTKGIREWFVK